MYPKYVPAILVAAVSLQAILVSAKAPDWVPPEMLDLIAEDKARCMAEHGTTQEIIDRVSEGDLVNDRSITCYMYCLLDAFSVVDEEANLDTDMLLSVIPDNLLKVATDVMNACSGTTGTDNCDKIYNLAKCVQSQVPELWFIV